MASSKKVAIAADNISNADTRDVNTDEELVAIKQAEYDYKANLTALRIGVSMHETLQNALSENKR